MKILGRKCKCVVTGEYGNTDIFVKYGNKYYKSDEIYQEDRKKKDTRKKLVDYICTEFLDYHPGQPFPPMLPKKLKELEYYDNEIILETFQQKAQDIHYWLKAKQFDSDIGRLSYIFAIVNNSISDIQRKKNIAKKQKLQQGQTYVEQNINLDDIGTTAIGKNLSTWLEEDEL